MVMMDEGPHDIFLSFFDNFCPKSKASDVGRNREGGRL